MRRRVLALFSAFLLACGLLMVPQGGPTFACRETGEVFTPTPDAAGVLVCCCGEEIGREFTGAAPAAPLAEAALSAGSCCELRASSCDPSQRAPAVAAPDLGALVAVLPSAPTSAPISPTAIRTPGALLASASSPRAPPRSPSSPRAPPVAS